MREAMAQNLLWCEVAAEIGHLGTVYGIVTNYLMWNFVRSLDEKIELKECVLQSYKHGPVEACLLKISARSYAMLSMNK